MPAFSIPSKKDEKLFNGLKSKNHGSLNFVIFDSDLNGPGWYLQSAWYSTPDLGPSFSCEDFLTIFEKPLNNPPA